MNLIRRIKIVSLDEKFSEEEKFFLGIFDDLEQHTSYDSETICLSKKKYGSYYFTYNSKHKDFVVSKDYVWEVLEEEFDMNYQQINDMIRSIMRRVFQSDDFMLRNDQFFRSESYYDDDDYSLEDEDYKVKL